MQRDDFSKTTIDKLKKRVAMKCSLCSAPTSGPGEGTDGENSIGVAAHICAAAANGPRYDPSMSTEERKSIENAIWMCGSCSRIIDNDVETYTTEELKKVKHEAEERAANELGKVPPTKEDAVKQLATAFTGEQSKFLPAAISNIHAASSKSLEQLDERFKIHTYFVDGTTIFGMHAKEDVSLTMSITGAEAGMFSEKYRSLIEDGKDIELDSNDVSIRGSDLFKTIEAMPSKGTFVISRQRHEAVQKIRVVDPNTNATHALDDIRGNVTVGEKQINFDGTACGEVFKFNYSCPIPDTDGSFTFHMSLDWGRWNGKNLHSLPYFEKLFSFFRLIDKKWELHTSLEINGLLIFSGGGAQEIHSSDFQYIYNFLTYTKRCRIICSYLGIDIPFGTGSSFTNDEHFEIATAADIIDGGRSNVSAASITDASAKLIADSDCRNVKHILEAPPGAFKSTEDGPTLRIFDRDVTLPPKHTYLTLVNLAIVEDPKLIQAGDQFTVVIMPLPDCALTVKYEKISTE